VAGVVGPPPAPAPPAAAVAAPPAVAVARNATASERGCAFHTPINRGRKRCTGDGNDDDEGDFSASNIMGMMMVQQRSEQRLRDAGRQI